MRTLLLTLALFTVQAQAQFSGLGLESPAFAKTVGGGVEAGGGSLNTADWSKGFESGALETGLTETDTGSKLDYAATAAYHSGSQSMSVSIDADAVIAHVRYDTGAARSAASICFWFYAPSASTGDTLLTLLHVAASTTGTQNLRAYYRKASGVYTITIRGTTLPTGVTVTPGNWYRVEIDYVQNATSTLRVFDTGGSQVGTDVTCTANNNSCQYLYFGCTESSGTARFDTYYIDDIGVDWTDSTFPLWQYTVSN